MRAIVRAQYGSPDVLQLTDVPRPVPAADEVLIRVHAVSVNGSDREGLIGRPLYVRIGGLRRPRHHILGSDVAGRVEMVGSRVREFVPGDDVFGELPGYHGGFAEFACAPEKMLVRKPAGLTFEEAAAIPQAGVIAFKGIRDNGQVESGQRVLINGAGGGAGSFAVQLAKMCGAEVTAVDSAEKLQFLRSLGADHVVDYAAEDFTEKGQQYDLILDIFANRSITAYVRALRPKGTCFFVGGTVGVLFQTLLLGPLIRRTAGRNVRLLVVPQSRTYLVAITELCEARRVMPVIDRLYPLEHARDAMRYVAEGHQKGKVVITVGRTPN